MMEFLGVSAFFFLSFVITLLMDFLGKTEQAQSKGMFLAELIVFMIFAVCGVSTIKRLCVSKEISKVKFSSEETVSIYC